MAQKFLGRALLAAGTVGVAVVAAAAPAVGESAAAAPAARVGPNTVTALYVLPVAVADAVTVTSLLTVGDAGSATSGYELVGVPDGIGLELRPDGRIGVSVNHELTLDTGIVRRHGQRGAFVSDYVVNRTTIASSPVRT